MDICRGNETRAYVNYCVYRIRMLLHFNVTPVLVFDGADLPMKADTHTERRTTREKALAEAEDAYARGERSKALKFYQRACPITSEMARLVIRQCRQMNVEYIVAPFEADAQLAWMMQTGHVDSVITEDSDLLAYGTSQIFFKMNREGNGDLFQRKNLPSLEKISFSNFTDDMIVYMCVCAGCDFFKGVHGLGILKAHSIVKRFRTLSRIIHAIRCNTKYRVSKTFTADFARACLVFRHQTVFDNRTGETVPLYPLSDSLIASLPDGVILKNDTGAPDLTFLGRHLDRSLAKQVAEGYIHPRTLVEYSEPLDLVQRPLTQDRPNPIPTQSVRKPAQCKPPSGFQVAGTRVPATPSQSSVLSVAPPRVATAQKRLRPAPNLKQRLAGLKSTPNGTSVFDPLREAYKFNMAKGPLTRPNNRFRIPLKIQSKPRNASVSNEGSPGAGSSEAEIGIRPEENKTQAEPLPDTGDGHSRGALKLKLSKLERGTQDSHLAKRPRLMPPAANAADAVNRVVSRFAVTSPGPTVKLPNASIRPPSPDHASFELFDEIDEFSRDGLRAETHANFNPKPAVEGDKSVPIDAPSSLKGPAANLGTRSRRNPKLSESGKQQLRVSRFFKPSQNGMATQLNVNSAGGFKRNLSRKKAHAPALESSRRNSEVQIDNLRRGATGKEVVAGPATYGSDS